MEIIKIGPYTKGIIGTCKKCQTIYRYFDSDIQEDIIKTPIFIDDTFYMGFDYYKVKSITCPGCNERIVLSKTKNT